jgi:hypothetical protein
MQLALIDKSAHAQVARTARLYQRRRRLRRDQMSGIEVTQTPIILRIRAVQELGTGGHANRYRRELRHFRNRAGGFRRQRPPCRPRSRGHDSPDFTEFFGSDHLACAGSRSLRPSGGARLRSHQRRCATRFRTRGQRPSPPVAKPNTRVSPMPMKPVQIRGDAPLRFTGHEARSCSRRAPDQPGH